MVDAGVDMEDAWQRSAQHWKAEAERLESEAKAFRELSSILGCFPGSPPETFLESAKELLEERQDAVKKVFALRAALKQAVDGLASVRTSTGRTSEEEPFKTASDNAKELLG